MDVQNRKYMYAAIMCGTFVLKNLRKYAAIIFGSSVLIYLLCFRTIVHKVDIKSGSENEERKPYIHMDLNLTNLQNLSEKTNASGSQLRNNSFYDTLILKMTKPSTTFALLITYGRSGSSWLGEMTSQANNTFYVFEPLQRVLSQGYFRENLVCFNNNTCRKPRRLLERHTTILRTLYNIFTCKMTKLHPFLKSSFRISLRSMGPKMALKKCLNSSSLDQCLKEMEQICAKTTHRILKTIRIPMEFVNTLMKLWPNLKVIHLIRDPRAITNSRLRSIEFNMARNVLAHSQDLCSRIHKDVLYSMKLQRTFSNRLKVVIYEALTARPLDGAKYIYKFLNMSFTEEVFHWVNYTTHADKTTKQYYYGTVRSNVEGAAFTWRIKMDLLKVQVVDFFCMDLYSVLGFVPINSTQELKAFTLSTRRNITIDGFV